MNLNIWGDFGKSVEVSRKETDLPSVGDDTRTSKKTHRQSFCTANSCQRDSKATCNPNSNSNHREEALRSSIGKTTLEPNHLEWILMETISWIAGKSVQLTRERVRRTAYRKLRRCRLKEAARSVDDERGSHENFGCERVCENAEVVGNLSNRMSEVSERLTHQKISDKGHLMGANQQVRANIRVERAQVRSSGRRQADGSLFSRLCIVLMLFCFFGKFPSSTSNIYHQPKAVVFSPFISAADASLIIGDSAIEIQEVGEAGNGAAVANQPLTSSEPPFEQPSVILGSTGVAVANPIEAQLSQGEQKESQPAGVSAAKKQSSSPAGPLPPIVGSGDASGAARAKQKGDDITDGDKNSRNSHDFDINELNPNDRQADKTALSQLLSSPSSEQPDRAEEKAIAGKVVDFELTPAGGHNKAKIKKKKKKKKQKKKEEEQFKKWGKKKKSEKKAMEKKHKESMKKKKEEGKKGKKKWGLEVHGQKKKGKFKKKKWGKKVKKGKGVKKGKKGKKFLKDKGHKNTGFKTVYHKEEWGKSSKWHDIKREKKWDEKSKKWKKKWKKEKGKKYKGDHMKKFEKKKKSGKKYKKEKKEKFKKSKKEEFKKGKKEKMEEHGKKKEGGSKKEMKKEEKKKKKKKKG